MPEPDDTSLVKQARSGSQQAFQKLFERYHPRIYRLAASMVGSSDEAHDLAQQTFIRAFSSLEGFKQQSSFYTWLYRIALNVTTDYRRKQARKLKKETSGDLADSRHALEKIPAPKEEAEAPAKEPAKADPEEEEDEIMSELNALREGLD